MEQLVAHGAALGAVDSEKATPLHKASKSAGAGVLRACACPNGTAVDVGLVTQLDAENGSALRCAVRNNNVEAVQYLLRSVPAEVATKLLTTFDVRSE